MGAKMKTIKHLSSTIIALSLLTVAQLASADGWPTRIVGVWTVNADNTPGTLNITFQATSGHCRQISGTIFNTNLIQGFYCPFSGRVHFLRKIAATNDTFQVYSANLSQVAVGPGLRMGGSFSDYGSPGEYSFFASK
jgi:hypothetical protein